MSKYFPSLLGRFKFMTPDGKVVSQSVIVRKYRKEYDSMEGEAFFHWLQDEKGVRLFYAG